MLTLAVKLERRQLLIIVSYQITHPIPTTKLCSSTKYIFKRNSDFDACENFYKYNCNKNQQPRLRPKLRDVRFLNVSDDIDQYQEYVVATTEPPRKIWEIINVDVVSKWLVQFETFRDGIHWSEHKKRHEEFLKLSPDEKQRSLVDLITPIPRKVIASFYKSLRQSVVHLTELKLPISTKNHFYHGLFNEVRDMHISEIKRYSKYSEAQKQILVDRVQNLKVIFPYLEYNDVKKWRQAKTEYERTYYRLHSIINETEISEKTVDKIIRIAAVDPALKIFEKYMTEFSPRFIFQHVNAAASRDSFNYQNEAHVSVFTMMDPQKNPQEVYHQFLFVLNHEMQHVHFNIDPPPFEPTIWETEKNCLLGELDRYSAEWKASNPDWNMNRFYYEDMANIAGLRLFVLHHAQRTSDDQTIRDAIENAMVVFCTENVGNVEHNPHDVSINTGVSQIPTFNKLYNCTEGQHMYVKPEDLCKTLNMDLDDNEFKPQKVTEEGLLILSQYMDVLEDTAVELDAANITTFDGELFDITVEDVEDKEEELEGSAMSSESSSESHEIGDDEINSSEDLDNERQSAEIVSSSRLRSIWKIALVAWAFVMLN
uniref:Uncharacterized protein n=1 Tax=Caenorhabditis japonica TaxID=281687 RepID=A0A8R1DKN0_CAEJA